MVKKLKSISTKRSSPTSGLLDSQLAGAVKDSAQQIWLAGMGAFAKTQQEGGKFFDALVKEGTSLQRKTQGLAEGKINEVTGKMSAMAGSVTAKAGQNWDKLEAIFEQRTAKALNKLGVPTAKDVDALIRRVDSLAASVAKLSKETKAPRAMARQAATVKRAVKKAVKSATTAAASMTDEVTSVAKPAAKKRVARKASVAA